ncbi:hypothetical protein [Phytohabitans flavus]|nr:hypothetical protein [Phytohabitans flavus]
MGKPTPRPWLGQLRLVLLLLGVLAALLVIRPIVVAASNSDGAPEEKLEGVRFEGRYFPIEKVCPVVDDSDLETGLEGNAALVEEGLTPTGNGFSVDEDDGIAAMDCGVTNWRFSRGEEKIAFLFTVRVYAGTPPPAPPCAPEEPGEKAAPVEVGPYRGCQTDDGFEATTVLVDRNAFVSCGVKSIEEDLLPGLTAATQRQCGRVFDALGKARPMGYLDSSFLTVR